MSTGLKYYVLDTETTGLDSFRNEVTEIGIIREEDKVQLFRKIRCERPETASLEALKITNKTMADLLQGDDKRKVVEDCNRFFEQDGLTRAHRCIVAHNFSFDKKFCHALWESVGMEFPADLWLCTMAMTRVHIKNTGIDIENKKNGLKKQAANLQASLDFLGVKKVAGLHNARDDGKNAYLLKKALIENANIDHLALMQTHVHTIASNKSSSDYTDEDFEAAFAQ